MDDRVEIFWAYVGSFLLSLIVVDDETSRPEPAREILAEPHESDWQGTQKALTSSPKSSPPRTQKHDSKSTHGKLGILHPDRRRQ